MRIRRTSERILNCATSILVAGRGGGHFDLSFFFFTSGMQYRAVYKNNEVPVYIQQKQLLRIHLLSFYFFYEQMKTSILLSKPLSVLLLFTCFRPKLMEELGKNKEVKVMYKRTT